MEPLLGVPKKSGFEWIPPQDWKEIERFIKERKWALNDEPAQIEDKEDPLLNEKPPYGNFMMGFDFHLTSKGPKLIEINTNAGGLATVFNFGRYPFEEPYIHDKFIKAILKEYKLAGNKAPPKLIAIIDDDVKNQKLYPEMLVFSDLLQRSGIKCVVISPEDLELSPEKKLFYQGQKIDLIYNRLVDFRMKEERHQAIRESSIANQVVLTPHPASYVRFADKRKLLTMQDPVIPKTFLLKDKPFEEWIKIKKNYIFKPADGAGSKGVYRGDKLSNSKLQSLSPFTIVQEYCPPALSSDGSKYDVRVYTRDSDILGLTTRQFCGQVMEMQSEKSGFKATLPEGICCFPKLIEPEKCETIWKNIDFCNCD